MSVRFGKQASGRVAGLSQYLLPAIMQLVHDKSDFGLSTGQGLTTSKWNFYCLRFLSNLDTINLVAYLFILRIVANAGLGVFWLWTSSFWKIKEKEWKGILKGLDGINKTILFKYWLSTLFFNPYILMHAWKIVKNSWEIKVYVLVSCCKT